MDATIEAGCLAASADHASASTHRLSMPQRTFTYPFEKDPRSSLPLSKQYEPQMMASHMSRDSIASSSSSPSRASTDTCPTQRSSTSSVSSAASYYSASLNVKSPSTSSFPSDVRSRRTLLKYDMRPACFQRLPQEVLEVVVEQLRSVHSDPLLASCPTCLLRDFHSMCLTSKACMKAARLNMYRTIWIIGRDSPLRIKKFRGDFAARLKLLRRTLRARPQLAEYVQQLKVPAISDSPFWHGTVDMKYVDLVASIVMTCPNLEKLVGFNLGYDHNFDRLSYALSTRPKLKERIWLISGEPADSKLATRPPRQFVHPEETRVFLHYHDRWTQLATLILHAGGNGVLEHEIFVGMLSRLSALRNLCVSGFDAEDFNDSTLSALPALRALRLQNLPGVTGRGLTQLAASQSVPNLQSLILVNLDIIELRVFSKLLVSLHALRRLVMIQGPSPEPPLGEAILQPIIGSLSLEFLHWDVLIPGAADDYLAGSISADGFPRLRVLRAPSDHRGVFQSVCKPLEQIALSSDRYRSAHNRPQTANQTKYVTNLPGARRAAQDRIEQARKRARVKVTVEEDGIINQAFTINDFVGQITSNVHYSLSPDVHASDNAIMDFDDLLDVSKEIAVHDGCNGAWNWEHPTGKKWWSHTERYRYQPVDLLSFF